MNPVQTTSPHGLPADQVAQIDRIFALQQANRSRIGQTTATERIAKLKRLHRAILAQKGEIREAMYRDFQKSPSEVDITEIYSVTHELKYAIANLKKWMKPQRVPTPLAMLGARSYIYREPRGVALLISPWNYPINLTLGPLVSAIAAGNCVMIKPSEYTPHTAALMKRMLSDLFEESEVAVFEGDYQVSTALLQKPFDHIFFTGSPRVGKIVMKAASEHLSSVTLELGGKSPVIVNPGANLEEAARKIVWGKFINKGQTCIAPDYLFVHRDDHDKLLTHLIERIKAQYGATEAAQKASPDYARIVNDLHFQRLENMLKGALDAGAKVAWGGQTDAETRYLAPTLLTHVHPESAVMQEEIFGPILPIIPYDQLEEPIRIINSKPKPLALYIFGRNAPQVERILQETTAGGTCVNDTAVHFGQHYLPFGGVNNSGMGQSHGHFGFLSFSHERAVLKQPTKWSGAQLLYPPYNKWVQRLIDLTIKWL